MLYMKMHVERIKKIYPNFHVRISLKIRLKTDGLHLFMEIHCNSIEHEIHHRDLNHRSMEHTGF